ncbi:MAG: hypothetical protein HXX16_04285 [Bacteroidales bacterium]|nr:hypothetical protein [Bacteroidales bacterium]
MAQITEIAYDIEKLTNDLPHHWLKNSKVFLDEDGSITFLVDFCDLVAFNIF